MKKRNVFAIVTFILSLVFVLSGCMKVIYAYHGIRYDSSEKALEAQKNDLDSITRNIPKTITPVGGSLAIILPTNSYIEKCCVSINGAFLDDEVKTEISRFTVETISILLQSHVAAIGKRAIFNSTFITYSDEPESVSFKADIALIYVKGKDGKGQWVIKKANDKSSIIEIESVKTQLSPIHDMISWLDDVENKARSE